MGVMESVLNDGDKHLENWVRRPGICQGQGSESQGRGCRPGNSRSLTYRSRNPHELEGDFREVIQHWIINGPSNSTGL